MIMNKTKYKKNERGVALLMVMVISAIVLIIMASMIYMLTTSTEISGLSKRYASASEAAQGAQDVLKRTIDWRGNAQFFTDMGITLATTQTCISNKILYATESWGADCTNLDVINPDDSNTYDMEFALGGFDVYAKIIHTVEGNTGGVAGGQTSAGDWSDIGVTHSTSGGEIDVRPINYYYTIEIDASRRVGGEIKERSRMSMLYMY